MTDNNEHSGGEVKKTAVLIPQNDKTSSLGSNKAIWLCEVLKEQEGIDLNWRVLKKYSDDFDEHSREDESSKAFRERVKNFVKFVEPFIKNVQYSEKEWQEVLNELGLGE